MCLRDVECSRVAFKQQRRVFVRFSHCRRRRRHPTEYKKEETISHGIEMKNDHERGVKNCMLYFNVFDGAHPIERKK